MNINCSSQIYQMTSTVIINQNHKLKIKVAWNIKLLKLKLNKIYFLFELFAKATFLF